MEYKICYFPRTGITILNDEAIITSMDGPEVIGVITYLHGEAIRRDPKGHSVIINTVSTFLSISIIKF